MKYEGGFVQSLSSQLNEPLLGVAEINLTWHALIIFIMLMLCELNSVCGKTHTQSFHQSEISTTNMIGI